MFLFLQNIGGFQEFFYSEMPEEKRVRVITSFKQMLKNRKSLLGFINPISRNPIPVQLFGIHKAPIVMPSPPYRFQP